MTQTTNPQLLNLGCGHINPVGWINVDGSNRAWLASKWPWVDGLLTRLRLIEPTEFSRQTVHANLLKRFPWPDDSIDGIYMGEILEHFTKSEGETVLRECYRVLKPGAPIRVRVPDFVQYCESYLGEFRAVQQRDRSQWDESHDRWVKMFFDDICVRPPGWFRSYGHFHKWMYDEVTLQLLMQGVGFQEVQRRRLHDSRLPGVEEVESRELLVVEAIKP